MATSEHLERLLTQFKAVADGTAIHRENGTFKTYAITNFRGGIGKSTLAFNLAWEISRRNKTLAFDLCPQCNFSQSLLGDALSADDKSIYDALLPLVMAGTPPVSEEDLLVS